MWLPKGHASQSFGQRPQDMGLEVRQLWRDVVMIEYVNGTIIGTVYHAYRFFRDGRRLTRLLYFVDDDEAEAWFRKNYPNEYQAGVEMRRYTDAER